MKNNLSRIVNYFQRKSTGRYKTKYNDITIEEEQNQICILLNLFISTKIFNSYLLMHSQISRQNDLPIIQNFKQLIFQLKDLSYISERHTHVEGCLSSKETSYRQK